MNALIDSFALWLADYYLLATVSLIIALLAGSRLKQPVQRLAVVKSTIVALFLLAALCAVPGWSLIHLMSHDPSRVETLPETAVNFVSVPDGTTPSTVPFRDQDVIPASVPAGRTSTVDTHVRIFDQRSDVSLPAGVSLAHLSGAAFGLAWLTLGAFAAHRLRRSSQPVPAELLALMTEVSHDQNNAEHSTELRSSTRIDVAVALGIFRPLVLLPGKWLETQSREELRTILAHECTHIRNGDLRWLAASRVLHILLWAQPLYWLLHCACVWTRKSSQMPQPPSSPVVSAMRNNSSRGPETSRSTPPHISPPPSDCGNVLRNCTAHCACSSTSDSRSSAIAHADGAAAPHR